MEARPRLLKHYLTAENRDPFGEWLQGLRDREARARIRLRLNRVMQGNFGDCESIGGGVKELRVDIGPGYRIYFGEDGGRLILLLGGGDKHTQDLDIAKAKERWKDYNA